MKNEINTRIAAAILSSEDEDGAVFDLPTERIAAIAAGAMPTFAEQDILLRSPIARQELVRELYLHDLRMREDWRARGVNDNDFRLRSMTQVAFAEPPQDLDLKCPAGKLTVRKGPTARMPFLLTLTMDPVFWGYRFTNQRVTVREAGDGGMVWMHGWTDTDGILRVVWTHQPNLGTPASRLSRLRKNGSVDLMIVPD